MTAIRQLLPRAKTSQLRDRIKQQSDLLDADFKRVEVQGDVLRESVVHSAVSPLGLSAAAAVGFVTGRRLLRKRRRPSPQPQAAEAAATTAARPTSWWLELLLPVAFTWLREIAIAHLRRDREPPPPSPPQ